MRISDWSSDVCSSDLAYISIQRRVDALSVVHRNHYAELEVHPGIGVRSLISELSVSLRGSMPEDAPNVAIHVQSDHLFVSQDVAVPVAFLKIGRASCRERVCQYV